MDMTRRSFVELAAMSATASIAPALDASAFPTRGSERPNILFMLGDDHRADVLGCMGNAIIQSPELDRLAREGVLFERHFCPTPICCTPRASIMLGQYGSNGEHGFAGKWYAHEESIHIPLIVYDPRQPATLRGKRLHSTTLTIDLHPTLLELGGVSIPTGTQGRSLVPKLKSEEEPPAREVFFIEHHFPDQGFIPSSEAIRTNRWKYIRYTDNAAPYEELYDLQTDRHEVHNLARSSQHARQFKTMQQYCTRWKQSFTSEGSHWTEPVTQTELQRDGLI
ncbi:MAG: sulfatase/phosphatase domain-containing protein [Acidobacteriaceae bacterium]